MTTAPPRRRGASLVAAGIGLSRIAGLVREVLLGAALGATPAADALRAAIRVPNLLQNLLGEGVLSASFIPVHARLLEEGRRDEARLVAAGVLGLLSVVAGLVALVIVVLARPITAVLAVGFSGERFELTVDLMRIVAVGTAVLVPSAWCLGVLNSHRRFFVSYVAPVAWNLVQIAVLALVVLRSWTPQGAAEAVAWSLIAAGVAQLLVQLPAVIRVSGPIRPHLDHRLAGVRETMRRFVPAVAGRGSAQLAAFVDLWLASLLAVGAVAAIGYAQILYLLPISLFAMSVAAAELPELSRLGREGTDELVDRTRTAIRRILLFVTFTAVAYLLAGRTIVAVLFERFRFDSDLSIVVGFVLGAFALALVPTACSRLLQNALYALGDVSGPARISFMRLVIGAVTGGALMLSFDRLFLLDGEITGFLELGEPLGLLPESVREDPELPLRFGAVGLALGSAIAAWFELVMLRQRLTWHLGRVQLLGRQGWAFVAAGLTAALMIGAALFATRGMPELVRAVAALAPAGVAYLVILRALGIGETADVIDPLRRIMGRVGIRR
ncbi:MAG: murein biosynthesis integral membrane protein MurJ [Actinomycetota bacterium]